MARGGFLGRIARAIKNVVAPSPGRHERPPPERPPEPPPEPPRPPPTPTGRGEYREIWRDYDTHRSNYSRHLAVFHSMIDPIEEDPQEQLELWRSYVRNIVAGEGQYRRNDNANLFWRDSGIDPRDWDWQAWREAMGFVGKRRSRTP